MTGKLDRTELITIIFLDIDGVLNTPRFQEIQIKNYECDDYESQFNFDPICMRNLKELVDKSNAFIVITSSWRTDKNDRFWKEIIYNLKAYELNDRIIGVTPDLSKEYNTLLCRGHEIQKWIDDNNTKYNLKDFAIIDDDDNMFPFENKLALCDYKDGFIKEVKEQALKILNID